MAEELSNVSRYAHISEQLIPDTKVVTKTRDFSKKFNKVRMYLASDWHFGTTGEILTPVKRFVDFCLKDPAGLMVINGDLFNLSKEGQQRDILSVDQILDVLVEILTPLQKQGKLLFVLSGNHDRRMMDSSDVDLIKQVCERLQKVAGSPLGEEATSALYYATATIYLKREDAPDKKVATQWLFHHGDAIAGVDRLKNLYNMFPNFNPDFIVCGHTHRPSTKSENVTYYDEDNNLIIKKCKYIVLPSTGSPTYSYAKNFKECSKAAGLIREIGVDRNIFYGLFPNEAPYVITCNEIHNSYDLDTKIKQACNEVASKEIAKRTEKTGATQVKYGKRAVDMLVAWQEENTRRVAQKLNALLAEENSSVVSSKVDVVLNGESFFDETLSGGCSEEADLNGINFEQLSFNDMLDSLENSEEDTQYTFDI